MKFLLIFASFVMMAEARPAARVAPSKVIVLRWTIPADSDALTGYTVYQKMSATNKALAQVAPMAEPLYAIPNLPNGTYSYFVTAKNIHGEGLPSNVVTVKLKGN